MLNRKIIILLVSIVCLIVIYEIVDLKINNSVPVTYNYSCEIVNVYQRIDSEGKTIKLDLNADQKSKLEEYIVKCTKRKSFYYSRGYGGIDYNILIRFVSFNPEYSPYDMLVGRKNIIQSDSKERMYYINNPEQVEKDIKEILQLI